MYNGLLSTQDENRCIAGTKRNSVRRTQKSLHLEDYHNPCYRMVSSTWVNDLSRSLLE